MKFNCLIIPEVLVVKHIYCYFQIVYVICERLLVLGGKEPEPTFDDKLLETTDVKKKRRKSMKVLKHSARGAFNNKGSTNHTDDEENEENNKANNSLDSDSDSSLSRTSTEYTPRTKQGDSSDNRERRKLYSVKKIVEALIGYENNEPCDDTMSINDELNEKIEKYIVSIDY